MIAFILKNERERKKNILDTFFFPPSIPDDELELDCDGVLFKGKTVFDGVPLFLSSLLGVPVPDHHHSHHHANVGAHHEQPHAAAKRNVLYVTNNSTSTRETYVKKFTDMGLPIALENMVNSR